MPSNFVRTCDCGGNGDIKIGGEYQCFSCRARNDKLYKERVTIIKALKHKEKLSKRMEKKTSSDCLVDFLDLDPIAGIGESLNILNKRLAEIS